MVLIDTLIADLKLTDDLRKCSNYYHFIDEEFYDKVKSKIGMKINLDFHKRHGKRVGSFAWKYKKCIC